MQSILQDIQDTVIQYANVIANVIGVDVEIVDSNLHRIAGTGEYKNKISQSMAGEGFVYKQVLKSGEPQFIEEPGTHELCRLCPKRQNCEEKLEMCMPIDLGESIIGVIGLICFTDEQRTRLLEKLDVYQEFLKQIADFISVKAYEKQERERDQQFLDLLNQVIDNVGQGVLILNREDKIVHANVSALKQLLLPKKYAGIPITLERTGDSLLDFEEFKVKIGARRFKLIGDLLPVAPRMAEYAKILIFNEIKKVKSGIYELNSLGKHITLDRIFGDSEAMQQLRRKIVKIAASNSTILISGESGTGKEMVARAIYAESDRRDLPFVAINCGAIPDTLLESELFGYVKGAFSGADPRGKMGKFELANRGVIFLDEIGDMPLYLQVKLLRVLQERSLTRIGSNQIIDIDVRVIAATNKDLRKMIEDNKFREDLFYRLNVIPVELPPLRERHGDVEKLAAYFVGKYAGLFDKSGITIGADALLALNGYSWPGNVRELENTIEFMINMVDDGGILSRDTLPQNLLQQQRTTEPSGPITLKPLREVEREMIRKALDVHGTTTKGKQLAAQALGIGIATLYRKLDEYHLS